MTFLPSLPLSFLLEIMNDGDVRVVQRGENLGLPLETRNTLRFIRHRFRENLDRNGPFQFRVVRAIDFAHPAGPIQTEDFIGTKPRARR